MTRDEDKESDRNLQQDVLFGRQFSLADVIGEEKEGTGSIPMQEENQEFDVSCQLERC